MTVAVDDPAPTAVLCLDLGGSAIKAAVLIGGSRIADAEAAIAPGEPVLDTALRAAREVLGIAGAGAPSAVGIAVPGIVHPDGRRLQTVYGKLDDLRGVDLAEWSRDRFGTPAVLENDARAALVGETRSDTGAARGAHDAVLVALGTGIGTAALVGGELVRGAHGHGGVLGGHITVDLDGPECVCGNAGCAEALASTWALERAVREHPSSASSAWAAQLARSGGGIAELVAGSDGGDPVAVELLDRFTRVWGAVIVTLCHVVDPEVVVLTGGVLRAGASVLDPVRAHVERHLWRSLPRPRLVVPERPELSVVRGLAVLAEARR